MRRLIVLLVVLVSLVPAARAQTTYQEEVTRTLSAIEDKLVALAETFDEAQYDWRPADGVYSVGEVLTHVAAANYIFPSLAGTAIPEGVDPRNMEETITEKEAIIEVLQASFDHAEAYAMGVEDTSLTGATRWFGNGENTVRGVLLGMTEHSSEHLGQLIAYARMNGVVPPWSAQ